MLHELVVEQVQFVRGNFATWLQCRDCTYSVIDVNLPTIQELMNQQIKHQEEVAQDA